MPLGSYDLARLFEDLVGGKPRARDLSQNSTRLVKSSEWSSLFVVRLQPLPNRCFIIISSLNEVIDRHAERVAVGAYIRVPPSIVLGLYVVALFTFFLVGVQSGDGEKRNYFAHIVLALILSVVFILIVDLDREQEGLLQVSQQPMLDLLRQLNP